ncbi:MAG: UMP kinase [Candidatus Aenigmarchaeota archaeon]|nr:UMP kinase [Candidatus Aenigmarchaeota archaeon]
MKIAIKVGGSVFCPGDKIDMDFVRHLSETLNALTEENRVLVVVGGGWLARSMIKAAVKKGETSEDKLHSIGIEASRINARFLIDELGDNAFGEIPKNEEEAVKALRTGKIVVLGGFRPGQTTDAVTLQCAEASGADLVVIGTDVKGVYTSDPKKDRKARFIPMISADELLAMVDTGNVEPGTKTIIDPVAARIIKKTGIKTVITDIRNLENIHDIVNGEEFDGTVVVG